MKKLEITLSSILLLTSFYTTHAFADLNLSKNCPVGSEYKNMDSNQDGMVSKSEFMKFHEQCFDKLKLKNGMLDLKGLNQENNNSLNNKPMGTTTNSLDTNSRDAVNGNKY